MAQPSRLTLLLAALTLSTTAGAQEAGQVIELDAVTVEAMRRAQPWLEVPASIGVYTRADIEARTIQRL